ncbi:MAG: hypothetical protein IKT00_13140 [Prevotella sp.]|nr:hypothetical protein [Prevotella sp.]
MTVIRGAAARDLTRSIPELVSRAVDGAWRTSKRQVRRRILQPPHSPFCRKRTVTLCSYVTTHRLILSTHGSYTATDLRMRCDIYPEG